MAGAALRLGAKNYFFAALPSLSFMPLVVVMVINSALVRSHQSTYSGSFGPVLPPGWVWLRRWYHLHFIFDMHFRTCMPPVISGEYADYRVTKVENHGCTKSAFNSRRWARRGLGSAGLGWARLAPPGSAGSAGSAPSAVSGIPTYVLCVHDVDEYELILQ